MKLDDIPRYRRASTCESCINSMLLMSNHMCHCQKYEVNVGLTGVCDSWESDKGDLHSVKKVANGARDQESNSHI